LVAKGIVAKVPFISGDCDDEGTLFSLSNRNITTESQLKTYMNTHYLSGEASSQLDRLLDLYPANPSAGSPFDTGDLNALTPQYKRLAALQGDLAFQAPRRFFIQNVSGRQNVWSYLSKRLKSLSELGSMHASDLFNIYGGEELTDYLINFANHLDPNGRTVSSWPRYTNASPKLMTFLDGTIHTTISTDDYRKEGMELLTELSLANPI